MIERIRRFLNWIPFFRNISRRKRMQEELVQRLEREKETVNQINRILASNLDVRKVVKAVHSELKPVLDSDRMTITLLDEPREGFRFFALEKDYDAGELVAEVTYPKKGTPLERVLESGNPVMIGDTAGSEFWVGQKLFQEGIRSLLVFPLTYKGTTLGTLNFGSCRLDHFTAQHVGFVRQIAPGLAISIVNSILLEEMKASEERYRTVVETAHDGVSVVDENHRFMYVNDKTPEILGYPKEELIGADFRAVMDDESRQRFTDQSGRDASSGVFRILRKGGEAGTIEMSSRTVKDSHGMKNTVSFIKDVTEKKRLEEKLLQNEKLKALGEMASGVAHDFNNALAVILGNAQLLLYSAQDEETRESLRTIEKVVRESALTVRRLQEFTSYKIQQELLRIDVNGIIRDVLEITRPKWRDEAQKNGIQIETVFVVGEVPTVVGDGSEIREVLASIVFNAIEAMPQGGRIEIKTFCKEGNAHVLVSDTGVGMTEEVRKRVFEPFFTTKPFTNSGLGLSMSYGIIKRHGGDIEVRSEAGKGTTFLIVLPQESDERVRPVEPSGGEGIEDRNIYPPIMKKTRICS
jgi:two-component system, sporulation sensor kinase E